MAGKYTNIIAAAPTTTICHAGPGTLHRIVVNKAAANGVITVYDGTAAQLVEIATITMPATLLQNHFVFEYEVDVATSVTVVTSGAAQDITVVTSGQSS